MTNIAFDATVTNGFVRFINLMEGFDLSGVGSSFSPVQVIAVVGTTTYTIQGTLLETSVIGSKIYLTGGTVDSITINENGTDTVLVTNAAMNAADLHTAVLAEEAAPTGPSLENFIGGQGFIYTGTAGADVLLASARSSDNVLVNLRGADLVSLAGGNDNFFLGNGNDTGNGGIGNDSLNGGYGNDSLTGWTGNDVLNGGADNDVLRAGSGNDRTYGGAGNDRLYGEQGNDGLNGGNGNDLLAGGAGYDRLSAGLGRDSLTGSLANGTDRDDFIFASAAEIGSGINRDRITDFDTGIDKINLVGLNLDAFIGGAAFSGTQAEARFIVSGANGLLQVDTDGNGTLNASLLLVGVTSIAALDLLL